MRTRFPLLALALPALALATTLIPHTLADRARDSDRVVLVQVLSRRTVADPADPRRLKTLTDVVVGQDVRGKGPERLTVVQLGGRSGGWELTVPGDATFAPGETAVLFLKCMAADRCALVAFGAGKLAVIGGDVLYEDLFTHKWVRRPLGDVLAELQKVGGREVSALTSRVAALVVATLTLCSAPALAQYNYLDFKMVSTQAQPFPYWIDNRVTTPAGLSLSAVTSATEGAWTAWNNVQCASPKAVDRGLAMPTVPFPDSRTDLYSVTPVWAITQGDPDYLTIVGSQYIASVALPLAYAGVLQTCDIFVNGPDFTWSTAAVTAPTAMDLQTVMLHETGHCLGLGHFGQWGSEIMYAVVGISDNQHAPSSVDAQALCARNPVGGVPGAPCYADGGCGPSLACVSQVTPLGTLPICANGCTLLTGAPCDLPLSCQSSSAVGGSFNGACLLPGLSVTEVGKPCGVPGDCNSSTALCFTPTTQPSGFPAWDQGYCTQSCDPGQAPCPGNSTCAQVNGLNRCVMNCRLGMADCRSGYACVPFGNGGVCAPACYTDADCLDTANYGCRTCDGQCVPRQNAGAQVGDVCTTDANCGLGQTCVQLDPVHSSTKVCALDCGRGCGNCPTGSTCHPIGIGNMYCLRNCTGPFTCSVGERCANLSTGLGCMPACLTDTACPLGQYCQSGECITTQPLDDGGACGSLCNQTDGGHPITVRPDAGVDPGGGTGGCGCSAPGFDAGLWFLAWAGVMAVRRRAWPAR